MRYLQPCVLIASLALLAACGDAPSAPAPGSTAPGGASGVDGTTQVDAGCPVLRADQTCPTRPLQARITVTVPGGSVVAAATSGADGRFRLPLAPGSYVLTCRNTTGAAVPTALPMRLRVQAGQWTHLTVTFDSGVR